MIYLDNSATTREYDEVIEQTYRLSKEIYGNPSSLHKFGVESSNLIRKSRTQLENFFSGSGDVVFTSGGTESDNMALHSSTRKLKRRGNKIITTKIEHPAILETCKRLGEEGFEIEYLDVDKNGVFKVEDLKSAIDDKTILVSIMTVNNETGMIQPLLPAYQCVDKFNKENGKKILFHTDAVQGFGKIIYKDAPFDLISISGHKFHAPKGVGALYLKKGTNLPPFITGGGQELGYRSSTENINGIAGIALAAKISYQDLENKQRYLEKLNNHLYSGLKSELDDIFINGSAEIGFGITDGGKRCPAVLNVSFLGTRGEVILHTLEQDEIFVSTGSACASNKKTSDSHVLKAMGLNHKEIEGAIRFSFSEFNTIEEIDICIDRISSAVKRFRKLGSFR